MIENMITVIWVTKGAPETIKKVVRGGEGEIDNRGRKIRTDEESGSNII